MPRGGLGRSGVWSKGSWYGAERFSSDGTQGAVTTEEGVSVRVGSFSEPAQDRRIFLREPRPDHLYLARSIARGRSQRGGLHVSFEEWEGLPGGSWLGRGRLVDGGGGACLVWMG